MWVVLLRQMNVNGLDNEMVRVYMLFWPFCMLLCCVLIVALLFLNVYAWDSAKGTRSTHSVSPSIDGHNQRNEWLEDEAFDPLKVNYGVIVDAGSSGSRVFVYSWPPHSGNPHELIELRPLLDSDKNPVVKKVSPGLSTFGQNPENATEHMKTLLDYVEDHIPKSKHPETSLFIMATAGLRLLPENQREAILSNLRTELPKRYDFIIMDQHIEMISGKWEGIYSWMAVNYVLGRFDHAETGNKDTLPAYDKDTNKTLYRPKTVGMLDMGGGSMQIAFEMASGSEKVPANQEHLITTVNMGCSEHDTEHEYRLYVTTFLGFGANMAMSNYETLLTKKATEIAESGVAEITIDDPCLNSEMSQTVHVSPSTSKPISESDQSKVSPTASLVYHRRGTGKWTECVDALKPLLKKENCAEIVTECSMNGAYQPQLSPNASEFYGFSEYWYSFNDVLRIGGPYEYPKLEKEASDFCNIQWARVLERQRKKLYDADSFRLRTQCFKSAWAATVLHDGFGFPKSWNNFRTASKIKNQEVQWTLGAILYKLRYFPLRDIRRLREMQHKATNVHHGQFRWVPSGLSQTILLCCMLVVMLVVLRHCMGLKSGGKSPRMTRNKSMWGYMMLETTDAPRLDGIRIERDNYVY